MNKLIFKRYYWLIVALFLLLVLATIFTETRIISYNFWDYSVKVKWIWYNYENDLNLFDDGVVHKITLDITDEQYDFMVEAYKEDETSEKEWVKINMTIDWVKISNVWVRLKWNLTLRSVLWVWWWKWWMWRNAVQSE